LDRYGNDWLPAERVQASLVRITQELATAIRSATPGQIFDRKIRVLRDRDEDSTYAVVRSQQKGHRVVEMRSTRNSRALFTDESKEVGYQSSLRTIRRVNP